MHAKLLEAGKHRIPSREDPDEQAWNYGVRCNHGPINKAIDCYLPKEEGEPFSLTLVATSQPFK